MIQFIAGLFIGGAVAFFAMCCVNISASNRAGPLPEVDEHGRTVYRAECKE